MTMNEMRMQVVQELEYEHPMTEWFLQFCDEHPTADNEKMTELMNAVIQLGQLVNKIEVE